MEERDMKLASTTIRSLLFGGLLAASLSSGFALAQQRDPYGSPVGNQPAQVEYGEIRQTVARISEIAGTVSYSRGDDPDDWQPANRNVPVTIGDRLYTDEQSRVELQVHGGDLVRLGSRTDLAVLNLTDDTKQFAVKSGVASFQIRRLDEDEVFEVDTPNAAVTFERPGDYRIDVDFDGNTRIAARDGRAEVAAGGGSILLSSGEAMQIDGVDSPRYDFVAIGPQDGWDRWVAERQARIARARSYEYVSNDIAGVDDLDEYGRWENVPRYGRVWTPTVVTAGWAPYRVGQWIWQDPWGWTWVSTEPWGWAPYHYGRWVFFSSRWYWAPVARPVSFVTYSPALVAFVGGGPGWSASVQVGGGFVGWFPLAPRDPLIPWWGPQVGVRVTNVTYVNRTYVTVVNQTAFVSGGVVTTNLVHDRAVLREVAAAPVLRGTLPLVPTREAIRITTRPGVAAAPRPPAAIVARPVVARVAPPPAPPSFQQKLAVIRENRGAPVAPAVAAEIAVRDRSRPQAITAVRPVAAESGRVTLQPRGEASTSAQAPRPAPVAPVRGRPMSTAERPVASAPVAAPRSVQARERQDSREAAPRPAAREPSPAQATQTREQPAAPSRVQRPTPAAVEPREPEDARGRSRVQAPTARPAAERPAVAPPTTRVAPPSARPATEAAPPDRSRDRSSAAPPAAGARTPQGPAVERREPPPRDRSVSRPTPKEQKRDAKKPEKEKTKKPNDQKEKEKPEEQDRR
jgi:Family of unknown function (DUF6600)/FecR protein